MTNSPTPVSLRVKPGPHRLAVTGIGNALLDIITQDSREVFRDLGLTKAAMSLIEEHQLETFYQAMGETIEVSGGSVANSIAGVAALGGTCGYIGKVARDPFGERFTHDLRSLGVELDLAMAAEDEGATGRCHVFISDDAQRTMATYLGASNQLRVSDIREDLIARSEITYVEGYLFDLAPAKEAIARVTHFAHQHDSMVALSLSDMFCVTRHRRDFLELVTNDVDVLLANETEVMALFGVDTLEAAHAAIDDLGLLAVVTRGPRGADVTFGSGVVSVPAHEVENVVDQNGAGDMFAAGFLYGLALGADPVESAQLGSLCAGEVISHLGARPEGDLEDLAIDAGLL
ncbi:MAG: adenosine kinase [Acidobacteriota bacterium]|nr:adenosine kinase [Acidobacteriota bacterium]MDE3030587.1 adenosine kinase [Acidobacteriota bacterium]MDE3092998.1 adenosine kinase [Acidobacteriota bacterium]MDE3146902.1 adenosine kinase [Acidobacteriota bacterium]